MLDPPVDLVESASFLMTLTVMRHRAAIAFVARSVAQYLEREKLARIVNIKVVIELPPVGIITMRGRMRTPPTEHLIECLRHIASEPR